MRNLLRLFVNLILILVPHSQPTISICVQIFTLQIRNQKAKARVKATFVPAVSRAVGTPLIAELSADDKEVEEDAVLDPVAVAVVELPSALAMEPAVL
jgi:hypothetical protein